MSNWQNTFREDVGPIVGWIYAIQLILVVPWFLGATVRGEQKLVFSWTEHVERFGVWDAALGLYLYILFYSFFLLLIGYGALWAFRVRQKRHLAIKHAIAFAIQQQKIRPTANLEAVCTSRKEINRFEDSRRGKLPAIEMVVSNLEQDVFLAFSNISEEERQQGEEIARWANAPRGVDKPFPYKPSR
jgi:hypothetical protein